MQYLTRTAVYSFLAIETVLNVAFMFFLWFRYSEYGTTEHLVMAIAMTLFTTMWIIMLIYILHRIELILCLYEIAAKIVSDQPMIILLSVVVGISEIIFQTPLHPFFFQCFIIALAGAVVSSFMVITHVVVIQDDRNPLSHKVKPQYVVSLCVIVFASIWFQCYIIAALKYLIGYVVGAWYFAA